MTHADYLAINNLWTMVSADLPLEPASDLWNKVFLAVPGFKEWLAEQEQEGGIFAPVADNVDLSTLE